MRVACAAGKGFGPAGEQSRKVKGGKQAKQAGFKSGDTKVRKLGGSGRDQRRVRSLHARAPASRF